MLCGSAFRSAVIACGIALFALTPGCDDAKFVTRDDGGGAPDGGADVDAGDAGPGCDLRRPPLRPLDTGDDGNDRVYVFWDIDLFPGTSWDDFGYDLDGVCTQSEDGPTACTNSMGAVEDGEGGLDNAYGGVLAGPLMAQFGGEEDLARQLQATGYLDLVLRVTEWNGEANDGQVTVSFAQSVCVIAQGSLETCETMTENPMWGTDVAAYVGDNAYSDADPTQPRIVDSAAYVANGQLVAKLPDRESLVFAVGGSIAIRVGFTDARFTATIHPDMGFIGDGALTGRWAITDILDTIALLGLCTSDPDYAFTIALINGQLAGAADVRSDPTTDGAGAACDAISATLRFKEGWPALFGGIVPTPTIPSPCP